MTRCRFWTFVLLAACATSHAAAEGQKAAPPTRAELETTFAKNLSGSALVGHFSVAGQNDDKPSASERYEIAQVSKLKDDYWVFQARIKYGKVDAKIPITLKVLWAGDTPMISMTDVTIPALGTFTCRILFYGDRYVGTWQHGKVGGHMWGRIEKTKPATKESDKSAS